MFNQTLISKELKFRLSFCGVKNFKFFFSRSMDFLMKVTSVVLLKDDGPRLGPSGTR